MPRTIDTITAIRVTNRRLSDGSEVCAVTLAQNGGAITWECITRKDADNLAEKLSEALVAHTIETVERW